MRRAPGSGRRATGVVPTCVGMQKTYHKPYYATRVLIQKSCRRRRVVMQKTCHVVSRTLCDTRSDSELVMQSQLHVCEDEEDVLQPVMPRVSLWRRRVIDIVRALWHVRLSKRVSDVVQHVLDSQKSCYRPRATSVRVIDFHFGAPQAHTYVGIGWPRGRGGLGRMTRSRVLLAAGQLTASTGRPILIDFIFVSADSDSDAHLATQRSGTSEYKSPIGDRR